jgi:undecaprenyl diphosphate synthase
MYPKHIAFILDGNRRWAKDNNVSTLEGHKAGFRAIKDIVKKSSDLGIEAISLYAFSTENWKRTKEEVGLLMKLFEYVLKGEFKEMIESGVRLIHIGRKNNLPKSLQKLIRESEEISQNNEKITIYLGLDYGGRDEILRAVNKIRNDETLGDEDITEEVFQKYLDLKTEPYPELLIRTSNEKRLSNFLLWQLAYAEFIFEDKMLPDFSVSDFERALEEFSSRKRRFGS